MYTDNDQSKFQLLKYMIAYFKYILTYFKHMITQCTQYVPLTLYSTVRHMYYLYLHYYYILVHFFVIVFFDKQIGVSLSINVTHFTERRDEKITPANTHTHTCMPTQCVCVYIYCFYLLKSSWDILSFSADMFSMNVIAPH